MTKYIHLIICLCTVLLLLVGCGSSQKSTQINVVPQINNEQAVTIETVQKTQPAMKTFEIEAYKWGYEPDRIEVNMGDKVRLIAHSRDVPHGLAISAFGVNMHLGGSDPDVAEFIADKQGTFTFYCSVPCGRGHGSMSGTLIVK